MEAPPRGAPSRAEQRWGPCSLQGKAPSDDGCLPGAGAPGPSPRAPRGPHQVVLRFGHVGVVGPAQGLVNAQGPGVVPLHLLELALVLAEQGQIVELLGHIRVVGAQDLGVTGSQVIWGHLGVVGHMLPAAVMTRLMSWELESRVVSQGTGHSRFKLVPGSHHMGKGMKGWGS